MLSSAISYVEQRGRKREERGGGGGEKGMEDREKGGGGRAEAALKVEGSREMESERWLGWDGSRKAAVACRGCDTGEFRCTPHCSDEQSGEVALLQCGV